MRTASLLRKFAGVFVDLSQSAGPASPKRPAPEEQVKSITLSFWLLLLAGLVFFFGFHDTQMETLVKHFLNADHMTPFESWEVGALVWNALFAIYFYLKVPPTDKLIVEKITPVIILLGVTGLTYLAARTLLWNTDPTDHRAAFRHVLYVLFIGVLFFFVDAVHACFQKSPRHKQEFKQCLLLADLPMVPALAVLVYFAHIRSSTQGKDLEAFLSGAISFQLLASTLIFACIQAGVFHQAFGRFRTLEPDPVPAAALQERATA